MPQEYGGIDANKSILTALGISGLLSGLGGAVQVLGMSGRLSQFAGQEGFRFRGHYRCPDRFLQPDRLLSPACFTVP